MKPEQQIVDLTKDLIRIPSTHSRPDEINRCADFIASWLGKHHITFSRSNVNGIPSVIVLPRESSAKVLLMAHFDVVEAEQQASFSPREADGRLFGRGAVDDKYAVALAMVLFSAHLERLRAAGRHQADMAFGLLLTGDEEKGGFNGAAPALKQIDTEFCLALDGGEPDLIVTKGKGLIHLELTAHGKAGHAARPWLAQNALDIIVDDYRAVSKLFEVEAPGHWHKTMVMSNCRAGDDSANKIPGKARALMDIRYTDDDDPDAIVADIRDIARSDIRVLAKEPVFTGGASPYLDLLVNISGGAAIGYGHGASDARFLSNHGIPGAIWGADGEMSQHSNEEHVVISSIHHLYGCLDNFINALM